LSKKIIITKAKIADTDKDIMAVLEDDKLVDLYTDVLNNESVIGNIYVARIGDIIPKIGGMFVNYKSDKKAFLPTKELKSPVVVKKYSKAEELKSGDEILIQITKEAIKTKEVTCSTNLTFTGKGFMLTVHNRSIGVSKKLGQEAKNHYKELVTPLFDENRYGIIIRSNITGFSDEDILESLKATIAHADELLSTSVHRSLYSDIRLANNDYIRVLSELNPDSVEKVVTDINEVFDGISKETDILSSKLLSSLTLYNDSMISLTKLYGLENKIENGLSKKVYLKSGAYLVIEQTETLNVIDINSGKNNSKNNEDYFLSINIEACDEIGRQLRLRSLSGMIIIDFINMKSEESYSKLIKYMRNVLKRDPVKTEFIDVTKLGLMEITRKKERSSLSERIYQKDVD